MAWHNKDISQIFKELAASERGLSRIEAKKRLNEYGPNALPEQKTDSVVKIFFRQFESPLIYLLLAVALAVFFVGEKSDAVIILVVLIFNSLMGSIQEGRANRTLSALKKITQTQAIVLRDGEEIFVPDFEVVPGDIIILREGEKIPADSRVIQSSSLRVDESILTGESALVHKTPANLKDETLQIADQKNMVFKGTHVMAGSGLAVVIATAINTEVGKISSRIIQIDTEIPLKKEIRDLSRTIIYAAGIMASVLFILGVAKNKSPAEMFATVVSLTVSVIPEGLPVVMTLVLATGVWKMSKRNALVKKLQAVEALGQATILAIDKTGTITSNELVVKKIFVNGSVFDIEGEGYEPKGIITKDGEAVSVPNHQDLLLAGRVAAFCANARTIFSEDKNSWNIIGDPTEAALKVFGEKAGFNKLDLDSESPLVFEVPFDYKNKYHATVHDWSGKNFLSVVGAPEHILKLSNKIWSGGGRYEILTQDKLAQLEALSNSLSKQGLRMLAFGIDPDRPDPDSKIENLIFGGFFGIKDTIRPEVKEAVAKAKKAGLKVVMITGDHELTARFIAGEVGIYGDKDLVITGRELDSLSDNALAKIIGRISVFARVNPEHKLKIISAYRKNGHIVAMTGDGVNDAPSLVGADLGISMGRIGSEVTKEASDIVLLDDNLNSIIAAIEEGRNIYRNVKKVILYLFSTSLGEVAAITGALVFNLPLPVLPAQIIWLNLVTDGFLTVALAMEPKEKDLLNYKKRNGSLLDPLIVKRSALMSIVMALGTLIILRNYLGGDIIKAQTMALTALAVFQWFNAWNCRSDSDSVFKTNPFSNIYLLLALLVVVFLQLLAIYNPLMQEILHTTSISFPEWVLIAGVALSIILVEEVRKWVYSYRSRFK